MPGKRLTLSGVRCDMEKYIVRITDEALADMAEIYHYIAKTLKAPDTALSQYDRIADEILTLDEFPERYRVVDFEPEHSAGLRRMLIDNYSVFYVIHGKHIVVTNVLYSASDIEQRLKERH